MYRLERDHRIREASAARTALKVDEALGVTSRFINLGWGQTGDHTAWKSILDMARLEFKQAEAFVKDENATDALRDRVDTVRQHLADADDGLRLDEEIDRLIVMALDSGKRKEAYKQAAGEIYKLFLARGMDLRDPDQGQRIIDWVKNHSARTQLKTLLTFWWAWTPEIMDRGRLTGIVLALDPGLGDIYNKWLIAFAFRNGDKLVELANESDVANLPDSGKVLMGIALASRGKVADAVRFLEHWQELHPSNYWLNRQLGMYLQQTQPPRLGESLRYLVAAVAIRPKDPKAQLALSSAYQKAGEASRAIAAHERALELSKSNQ
jgi:tetratricopeptide (TPR) repeat protein